MIKDIIWKKRDIDYNKVWENNKGTYLIMAGIFLLVSGFLFFINIKEIQTVYSGKKIVVTITDIQHSNPRTVGYSKSFGSTKIYFYYQINGKKIQRNILLPTNGFKNIEIGSQIPLLKNKNTYVIPRYWPYFFSLIVALSISLLSLSAFYYHFWVFKKKRTNIS